jgi:restriction system protein
LHSHLAVAAAIAQARFNPSALAALSCRDVERLIAETFRGRGFQLAGFGMRAASGAADLALLKSGERFLVHCQHWRKPEIGVLAVRELSAALDKVAAQGGYVLTAGGFTREACEFARARPIELIGGEKLIAWLRGAERGEKAGRVVRKPARAMAGIA